MSRKTETKAKVKKKGKTERAIKKQTEKRGKGNKKN
jgi:hypothetical protein